MADAVLQRIHDAHAQAKEALTRIDGHEKLCAERWAEARKAFDRIFDQQSSIQAEIRKQAEATHTNIDAIRDAVSQKVGGVYNKVWWIVGLIVGGQGAVLLMLASWLRSH